MIPNKRDICDNLDADGLRDFILDRGGVIEFNEPHHFSEDYHLLPDNDIRDIDYELQKSITKLHLHKLHKLMALSDSVDFTNYVFNRLEIITFDSGCLDTIKSLRFTSNHLYLLSNMLIYRLTIIKDNNSWRNWMFEVFRFII